MTRRPYKPDQFDLLGGSAPAGTLPGDDGRWRFWQNRGIPGEDALTRLEMEKAIEDSGWRATYGQGWDHEGNPVVGRVMMPETAASESEWEQRNMALHEQQSATHDAWMDEHAPPKPNENTLAGRVVRGD